MLTNILFFVVGNGSGVLLTALALHLNRKAVAAQVAQYLKDHAADLANKG